jgi:hypothetical protein
MRGLGFFLARVNRIGNETNPMRYNEEVALI